MIITRREHTLGKQRGSALHTAHILYDDSKACITLMSCSKESSEKYIKLVVEEYNKLENKEKNNE